MAQISFIHLSDIHFVKSSNNPTDIDKDLRDAIITDLTVNAAKTLDNISGILVTGDIAFSGVDAEYEIAKKYLNDLASMFSIKASDIYCVPGNHDINQIAVEQDHIVFNEQCTIDSEVSIDAADKAFAKSINVPRFNDVLFEPIRAYNSFAGRFKCDISPDKLTWCQDFNLDYGLNLRLVGINSCFLSNRTDHQPSLPDRLMYIGQAQIPPRIPDTAVLLMCHHPPEYWKFKDDIIDRINKRADVQLYGHMHTQALQLNEKNAILFSGAAHPTRAVGWLPRYNWITIGSSIVNGDRHLDIQIYPRVLSETRDCFIADKENTANSNCICHSINIDFKRRCDLEDGVEELDPYSDMDENMKCNEEQSSVQNDRKEPEIDERELIYNFYELSVVRQMELLNSLELLEETDRGKSMSTLLNKVIDRAKAQDKFVLLWDLISKGVSKREDIS